MTVPPWIPVVRLRGDGRYDALLDVAGQPLATREQAEELVAFVLGHLDNRLTDVAEQIDAALAKPVRQTANAARRPVVAAPPPVKGHVPPFFQSRP